MNRIGKKTQQPQNNNNKNPKQNTVKAPSSLWFHTFLSLSRSLCVGSVWRVNYSITTSSLMLSYIFHMFVLVCLKYGIWILLHMSLCVVCVLPFFCLFKSQFNSQWHIHPRQIKNNNCHLLFGPVQHGMTYLFTEQWQKNTSRTCTQQTLTQYRKVMSQGALIKLHKPYVCKTAPGTLLVSSVNLDY